MEAPEDVSSPATGMPPHASNPETAKPHAVAEASAEDGWDFDDMELEGGDQEPETCPAPAERPGSAGGGAEPPRSGGASSTPEATTNPRELFLLRQELEQLRRQSRETAESVAQQRAARDALVAERDAALAARDAALAAQDAALSERDAAVAERDAAVASRNSERARAEELARENAQLTVAALPPELEGRDVDSAQGRAAELARDRVAELERENTEALAARDAERERAEALTREHARLQAEHARLVAAAVPPELGGRDTEFRQEVERAQERVAELERENARLAANLAAPREATATALGLGPLEGYAAELQELCASLEHVLRED